MSTPTPSIVAALSEKIGGYEALPLLDTEYNHPEVQHMVLRMIQEEMKAFQPPKDNYLTALPYPKLKFSNAPGFAQEYERIKGSQGSNVGGEINGDTYAMKKQVDMSRYNVPGPKGALKEDAQAWRSAVINARVQLEHQQNRLMNLELESEHGDPVWLAYLASLEGVATRASVLAEEALKEKRVINSQRLSAQRASAPTLSKITGKRSEALMRVLALQNAVCQLEAQNSHANDQDTASKRQKGN
jgi:pre-mRNA-splicing factor SPF27